jgi:transcriptional pleiotropic regulator of transition state genes
VAHRSTGIVRRLDRLGRIVIPKELRDTLALERHTQLAFAVDGDAMVLQRRELCCVFCGAGEHVIPHRGKGICVECIREVREMGSDG